jgi:hypothetical protein
MRFLDWMKGRGGGGKKPTIEKAKDETPKYAKPAYTQAHEREQAAVRPITPDVQAQTDRALATINKASFYVHAPAPPTAFESGGSPNAHLQKQDYQAKTQEALSPTDAASGKTALQDQGKGPHKPKPRTPPTIARKPPSWER